MEIRGPEISINIIIRLNIAYEATKIKNNKKKKKEKKTCSLCLDKRFSCSKGIKKGKRRVDGSIGTNLIFFSYFFSLHKYLQYLIQDLITISTNLSSLVCFNN